jgi:hypothetical protein
MNAVTEVETSQEAVMMTTMARMSRLVAFRESASIYLELPHSVHRVHEGTTVYPISEKEF